MVIYRKDNTSLALTANYISGAVFLYKLTRSTLIPSKFSGRWSYKLTRAYMFDEMFMEVLKGEFGN